MCVCIHVCEYTRTQTHAYTLLYTFARVFKNTGTTLDTVRSILGKKPLPKPLTMHWQLRELYLGKEPLPQWIKQLRTMHGPKSIRHSSFGDQFGNSCAVQFQKIAPSAFFFGCAKKFWKRKISRSSEQYFRGLWAIFLVSELHQKRGAWYTTIHWIPINWCHHSVAPCALMCLLKQGNLSAWSLLIWHPTYTHIWGRLSVFQICLLCTVMVTPSHFVIPDCDYVNRSASVEQFRYRSASVEWFWLKSRRRAEGWGEL